MRNIDPMVKIRWTYCLGLFGLMLYGSVQAQIDRQELVTRHNMSHSGVDPLNVFTIGNGEFAFTADITGLQTFPEYYEKGIPLGTQSQWGWHSFPNPEGFTLEDVIRYYSVGNDSVPYYDQFDSDPDARRKAATRWLRENPHRLHLGLIGLELLKKDGSEVCIKDIQDPHQHLDLWTGELTSRFSIEGEPVELVTLCHQDLDMISVKVTSPLIGEGRLQIRLHFPYAAHEKFSPGYDFTKPPEHSSKIIDRSDTGVLIRRILDETEYFTQINLQEGLRFVRSARHEFRIVPGPDMHSFAVGILFSDKVNRQVLPDFDRTRTNNRSRWEQFWMSGGAIDFSGSVHPAAPELERRIILSQYLTKVQCSGSLPPQETGLTFNSWHGKFHLEMHWWHMVHFILWNRTGLIEKQLKYYRSIQDRAGGTAVFQGYRGVRWPKMTDPAGRESPSSIGVFLIWQQPHFIYYADLLYRQSGEDPDVLKKYSGQVFATAEFMASYARFDSMSGSYVLGPALIPAQERYRPEETLNPAFELVYWYWGLKTAQSWKEALEGRRDTLWQHVIDHLSVPAVKDSLYLFTANAEDSYSNPCYLEDHPMVLGMLGMIPETGRIDPEIMENTFEAVTGSWNWETCWGWDFPMAAINAAYLGHPETALEWLMMDTPKNTWLPNGHNYQDPTLSVYLPGNGALLTAMAILCSLEEHTPGAAFPKAAGWNVRYENLFYPY